MRRSVVAGAMLVGALIGCGGAPTRSDTDPVAHLLGGPVARGLVTGAPEAWIEVLREADRVRGLEGLERADGEAELALALEWAQAVAELGAADRALASATSQRAALVEEQTGLAAEQTQLAAEAQASLAAHASVQRAQQVSRAPSAVEVARRAATADELDQQSELLLAAAELFGARPEALNPLRARLADAGPAGRDRVSASAALYRAAENLLASARSASAPVSTADVDALRLQASLVASEGVDAQRDARGVVAVLRGLFVGGRLAPTSRSRVELLGRVIRSHGTLPVRLECFVGGALAAAAPTARTQCAALRAALLAAGVPAERVQTAGFRRIPGGARGEDRVEVVLLSPAAE